MFRNKKLNMVVALVVSMILWMYVIGDSDPLINKKFEAMPIQLINMESLASNNLAIDSIETETIDVLVEGKKSILKDVSKDDFKIIADLYGRHNGKNYVSLDVQTPRGVKVSEKSKDKILVDIGVLVSASREVELDVKGEMPENTALGEVKVDPKKVTVYGTKNNIDRVSSVRGTVQAKDLNENMEAFKIDLQAKDRKGKVVQFVKISREEATAYAQLIHAKNIPLEVETRGKVDDSVELDNVVAPESVLIEGEAASLNEIDKLKCRPINIEGLTKTTKFDLQFDLPDGVKVSKESDKLFATVKIKEPIEKKVEIEPNKIKIKNLNSDLKGEIKTKVSISVKAKQAIADSIAAKDFDVSVDAGGLREGIHSRALSCTCKKNIVGFELHPSSVKLVLKEE